MTQTTSPHETLQSTFGFPAWREGQEPVISKLLDAKSVLAIFPTGAATFPPNGRALATGGAEGVVLLWDVPSGQLQTTLADHSGAIRNLAFSADGDRTPKKYLGYFARH